MGCGTGLPRRSVYDYFSPRSCFTSCVSASLILMMGAPGLSSWPSPELRLFGRHAVDLVSTRDVVSLDYSLTPALEESPGTAALLVS